MFYLYASIVDSEPVGEFITEEEAKYWGNRWFVGGGIIRTTPTYNFWA